MAQPQSQVPPRAFSPPQHTPSPAAMSPAYALPPNKQARMDAPPQPASPYANSSFAVSPPAIGTPTTTAATPPYAPTPPASGATPLTNGHSAMDASDQCAVISPPLPTAPAPQVAIPQYTNAIMTPIPREAASPGVSTMGPPQRPAERSTKDYEYDVTDSLAGTGIDLRAEEQYMSDMFSSVWDSSREARTGFSQHPAGAKTSFYGAGPANQPAAANVPQDQDQLATEAAEQAWMESSKRLATERMQEVKNPFLLIALLHQRAEKIAGEHHLSLNLDMKANSQSAGRLRMPDEVATPKVTVRVEPGLDSTRVMTTGSFIPHDAYLVDQLALLSIATKHRLRTLLEDADVIATHRQTTSHGEIPEEWSIAAAPMNAEPLELMDGQGDAMSTDQTSGSTTDRGTNPLKRRADMMSPSSEGRGFTKLPKLLSSTTASMRERARQEREWEEARLRKRQKRKEASTDGASAPSRSTSVAPGTPGPMGSAGAEGGKKAPQPKMTKKELRKSQALKAAEAHSHANQNQTSSMFAGLGMKSGLFGKKKGKTYDWMNVGRPASGTSTPSRAAGGNKGGGGGGGGEAPAGGPGIGGSQALTAEGRNRLGTWREDKERGRNIQLRDWVAVLERDGRALKALARAYLELDASCSKR